MIAAGKASLLLRRLGRADYEPVWHAMRAFTDARSAATPDELWLVEHPPVYTMGLKGRDGSAREIGGIPVVYTDRGGDMTYHGPGQAVLYPLLDLTRLGIGIRTLVQTLEQVVIDHLAQHAITGLRRPGAPGVYVEQNKIAALGLRVRRGCSYHGLSFNVEMDLVPFSRIDPCGYPGLGVTQLADWRIAESPGVSALALAQRLAARLGYNSLVPVPPTDVTTLAPASHE
jgi:lipoyl(octanoyl) transferase